MDMANTRLPHPFYPRHHPPLHLQLTPTLQTPETTAERWRSHSVSISVPKFNIRAGKKKISHGVRFSVEVGRGCVLCKRNLPITYPSAETSFITSLLYFLEQLTSMGNYASCTLATASKPAKVVLPTGNVRQLADGTNAAELMLEIPNHFVVNARSMHVGRRFAPLSADEELNKGNVYVLFPMRRVSSVVTAADMGVLLMMARSTVKRASGGKAGILPEAKERLEEDVVGVAEVKGRLSVSRSKKPALATIVEEPISSRRRDVTKFFLA